MSDKRNILLNVIGMILCIVLSYLFYYFISMDFINLFYSVNEVNGFFLYLCHIAFFWYIYKTLFKLRITKVEKAIALIIYLFIMYIAFFDRFDLGRREINLNPINDLSSSAIPIMVLNIAIFLPFYTILKWNFKSHTGKIDICICLIISIIIESIQYITMRGIFDIVDIIMYLLGYFLGKILYSFFFK